MGADGQAGTLELWRFIEQLRSQEGRHEVQVGRWALRRAWSPLPGQSLVLGQGLRQEAPGRELGLGVTERFHFSAMCLTLWVPSSHCPAASCVST